MIDSTMTGGVQAPLVQTWVPVTDDRGRTTLEAHWAEPVPSGAPVQVGHAA